MAENSDAMLDTLSTVTGDTMIVQDEAKRQISVLDTAKIPYTNATKNLDRALHNLITPVNDTLYATRDAYDQRVDVQNCRSDLFWRLTGITSTATGTPDGHTIQYTFTCTKLSSVYEKTGGAAGLTSTTAGAGSSVGISTNSVTYFDGTTFNSLGTQASTNFMTILDPNIEIKVGQLATPSLSGYFATKSLTVTGVGTTAVDLSSYSFTGIATSRLHTVPYITVDQLPILGFDAPLSTATSDAGEFMDILFSQDPSTISDSMAVSIEDSPYVDQTIEIMSYNRAGAGVSVYYTNTGIASGTRSWNKFMNGLPDPDTEDPEDMDTKISEPPIGAGKIYYRVGFPDKPVLGGSDASEGDTIIVDKDLVTSTTLYSSLSGCDPDALDIAILARDNSETALASNPARDGMAEVSNQIKTKVNEEFNLRIWAYRAQIGTSNARRLNYFSFEDLMKNSPYKDIINADPDDE